MEKHSLSLLCIYQEKASKSKVVVWAVNLLKIKFWGWAGGRGGGGANPQAPTRAEVIHVQLF